MFLFLGNYGVSSDGSLVSIFGWLRRRPVAETGPRRIPEEVIQRIWPDGGYKVFLSHVSAVRAETGQLKTRLSSFGVSCFVAHQDIQPTLAWQGEIESALHTMDAFIALLTNDFHQSDWTDQETGFAFARGVPIVAVRLGRDPYGFISRFQALNATWDTAPVGIAKLLIKNSGMFDAYIGALRKCPSWASGNILAELLPAIDNISESQVDQLVSAYNETDELHGSFGFGGHNPVYYGPGIVSHLNRLSAREFRFMDDRLVELVA